MRLGVLSESVYEPGRESVVYTMSACFLMFEVVHKTSPPWYAIRAMFSVTGRTGMVAIADPCLFAGNAGGDLPSRPLDVIGLQLV